MPTSLIAQLSDQVSSIAKQLHTSSWTTASNYFEQQEQFLAGAIPNPLFEYPQVPELLLTELMDQARGLDFTQHDDLESYLLSRKLQELKLELSMLLNRESKYFSEVTAELYGLEFSQPLIQAAEQDLQLDATFGLEENPQPAHIQELFAQKLHDAGAVDWQVELSDDPGFRIRVRPGQRQVFISKFLQFEFTDLDSTIAHEFDGHIVRSLNAQRQSNPLLKKTLPFYSKTEEGVACFLADYCSTAEEMNRKYHALKYLAGKLAVSGDFRIVFELFCYYGISPKASFQRTYRLKRGITAADTLGCFGREAVYYQGMREVKAFLDNGGKPELLFAWKAGLEDLPYLPTPSGVLVPERLKRYLQYK